jgi:peptidoglycan/xylan/chitin deacetylase (PgdA/CDA1 family)
VADRAGAFADWDRDLGDPAPLLDWPTIRRLASEGVEFESHSGPHRAMTGVAPAELVDQERRARQTLERELGRAVTAIAYPYGDADEVVRQAARCAGYRIGIGTEPGLATVWDDPMAIPRVEVRGDRDLAAFVEGLGRPRGADGGRSR